MKTYLFDASAAVELYLPGERRVKRAAAYLYEQKVKFREAALFIPTFCIAKVFNTLARKHFRPTDNDVPLTESSYRDCLEKFRRDVHWGSVFYPYELHRYHVVGADGVITVEHHFAAKDNRKHLSTYDILIIAMACELAYAGVAEETFLVTADERIKQVVDEFRRTDLSQLRGKIPEGPLGQIDPRRWIPPKCIYVYNVRPGDLERVEGQGPVHL